MIDESLFQPDWLSPPGETIADILEERSITEQDLGRAMEVSGDEIRGLLTGSKPVTPKAAQKLETVLGGSQEFWVARERRYREALRVLAERTVDSETSAWLKQLPIRDMEAFGWMPSSETKSYRAANCLRFFGVSDVAAWRQLYEQVLQTAVLRTSAKYTSAPGAIAAWLRRGEIEAAEVSCEPWDADHFRKVTNEVRALTRERNPSIFISELRHAFAKCGVAVVILRAPSGCRASGATRFLSSRKALMLLSFRHLSDDQFWFSVFHEAGHLLLHGRNALFVDGPQTPHSKQEHEANEFSATTLVPQEHRAEMMSLAVDGRDVMRFARKIGVSPGIVVGQMQYLGHLTNRQLNNLKRRYTWRDE